MSNSFQLCSTHFPGVAKNFTFSRGAGYGPAVHIAKQKLSSKVFLLCSRPKRMNCIVRMLAMTDCGYSPVHGFTVVAALQY